MNLQRFGLIVMALNLVFLPAVRSSAADLSGSSQSITLSSDCGCSMEFDQSSTAPGNKRVPLGPHPQCPTNCTMEVWTWYYCLRESDTDCDLWCHDFRRWFCSGASYYNCNGYSWGQCSEDCGELSCGNPDLPLGCVPPLPPGNTYCNP